MADFKVGDEVVCINIHNGGGLLTKGKIYMINSIDDEFVRVENDVKKINNFYPYRFKLAQKQVIEKVIETEINTDDWTDNQLEVYGSW